MEMWRIFLPYCLLKLNSDNWILLNRKYKPMGMSTKERVDYDKSETIFRLKKTPTKLLDEIATNIYIREEGTFYYLYEDSCTPFSEKKHTDNYFSKLRRIMKLKAE